MDTKEIVKKLNELIQLDIDAVNAYSQAIDRIDVPGIRERIEEFRGDHERHIEQLSEKVRALGEEPPDKSADVKGYFIEGFTALRSITGTEGALKAMKSNEQITNKKYAGALKLDFPDDIKEIVQSNRDDERRHLEYISQAIDNKIWEGAGREAHP